MFENSLIALGPRRPATRRWLSLPVAVVLHLAALASVAFAQYWQVDRVVEPDLNIIYVEAAPLPAVPREPDPEPSEPSGSRRPSSIPPAPAPPVPPAPGPVQPPSVPDVIPPIPATPEPGDGSFSDGGTSWRGVPGLEGLGGDGSGSDGSGGGGHGDGDGSGDGSGDVIYKTGNGVSRPEIVRRIDPRYTESARKARLQGTVILEAVIDEQGRVLDVRVLKGLPMGLDRSAVEAVSQWRFRPAIYEGRAVKVRFSLTVNFVVN